MIEKTLLRISVIILFTIVSQATLAQQENSNNDFGSKYNTRNNNMVSISIGSMLLNGDFKKPEYENYLQLQFKRFIIPSLNINGNIKKFDIEDYAFKEKGFLSGDLNLEWCIMPQSKFAPQLYIGAGILSTNNFEDQNYKIQGGLGLEYLITSQLALASSLEINYVYDEQKGSNLMQQIDDMYYNLSIGLCFYFGDKSSKIKKIKEGQSTIINTNLIE